jgi:hypothetical protein
MGWRAGCGGSASGDAPMNDDPGVYSHNEETGALDRPTETIATINVVASPEPQSFDYETLTPDLADAARAARDRIKAIKAKIHSALYEIGRDLIDMKSRLGHGNFSLWVAAELNFSLRTAENYIRAANFIADKNETVALFSPKAIYALAAPSAPREIVEQVLAEADAGNLISADEIRQRLLNASAGAGRKPEVGKSAEPLKKVRDSAKHELAAEAMPPQKDQEEEHEATEAKRNDKARCVAQFLVEMLDAGGVTELLSLLNGTDWNRVEAYLRSSNWLDGKWQLSADDEIENRLWREIEIPPLWSDTQA